MVPAQMLAEVESDEDTEDHQRDNLLDYLELDGREAIGAQAVGRHLKAVLKEGDGPTDQDDLPQRLVTEAEMAVPGEGHEDVGDDEQNDGPHDILGCGKVARGSVASTMTALNENLEQLEDAIAGACRNAGRARAEVELMAVSKTYPAATIAEAAALGLSLFGENRVQEFALKSPDLTVLRSPATNEGCPILSAPFAERVGEHNPQPARFRVHLIGHLQSNKALRAVELFDGIDSVDSLRLAERLNEAAGKCGKRLPILIEVKLSPEETKAGLDPESADAARLLERLPDLGNLETRGLMTIAPWGVPEAETRACFRALRGWRERWTKEHPRLALDVLSMGMSGDFAVAIEEGATRIRIGTALFGKRGPYTGPA